MSSKSPIFPIPDSQHFSDYGFDPQINYFQFLEEARRHKREAKTAKSIDSFHFKLQKPISKDEYSSSHSRGSKIHKKKQRWWRSAFLFFKWKWVSSNHHHRHDEHHQDVHRARARAFRASISGPVYMTESRSGSSTPYRTTRRPSSGPLAGTLAPAVKGNLDIPYLNMEQQQQQRTSASAMPIYLVT